ncbi:radical SAM protein [Acetatifactor muris]|uniref:Molybdenum cofactor biosynthesis protein A n=1 Tax=Acetatifactor muris TaxID=879566 RepID=A0A2K4ZK95_9FIRM|nr:radical SAM/SPASM domain-containing protein [Acetatifactor muris]MCR2049035.1 radical SAM protein [Acetatifactor muris]SOY30822.1 molybdenum cofactor biosynthesis protein A [Acetatifactor muris]
MIYNIVTFLLTNKCNLQCPHCCIECSPQNNVVLDDKLVNQVISDLALNAKVDTIGISGGEAFLYPDKVLQMVQAINRAGKMPSVYTNGFWCGDYSEAYGMLYDLKDNGLRLLLTSVDEYHQKNIPIDNIKYLLNAANELGIPVKIHVSTTYSGMAENDRLISSLGLSKISASITTSAVYSVGRAADCIVKKDFISIKNLSQLKCSYDGMCSIDWNGDVHWCCTFCNKNMVLGNIQNENINVILNKFRKNKVFMCILTKGFAYLVEIIERNKIMSLNKYYVNGCELCNNIFENEDALEQLNRIL